MPGLRAKSVWWIAAVCVSGGLCGAGLSGAAAVVSVPEVDVHDPRVPYTTDELLEYFLKQIEREEAEALTQEQLDALDPVALSQATPFCSLPADLHTESKLLLGKGIDRRAWFEAMSRALERLVDMPRTAARDRVLGTGANSLAMHYWSVGVQEARPEYEARSREMFRFGIEHSRYHPARIEAGRMYGQSCYTPHGVGSEEAIFGFRSAFESFHAMPEGAQKEFVRGKYVNTASQLFTSLRASGDFAGAYRVGHGLLSDDRNHEHISSLDGLATLYMSIADSAIRAGDAEAARAAVADAIAFVEDLATDPESETRFEPEVVRESLMSRLERMPAVRSESLG